MKFIPHFLILTLALALQSLSPIAQAAGLPAVTDFRVEAKDARKKQVPILVLFMSESCPYCETVLQDFLLPMQRDREYDSKVILRQIETRSRDPLIDFDGNVTTQSAFSSKHKIGGVPVVMLFDSKGTVLTSIKGLLTVDFYLAYLDNAINESQEKIKAAAH
jgi:thioredoxin-related protein